MARISTLVSFFEAEGRALPVRRKRFAQALDSCSRSGAWIIFVDGFCAWPSFRPQETRAIALRGADMKKPSESVRIAKRLLRLHLATPTARACLVSQQWSCMSAGHGRSRQPTNSGQSQPLPFETHLCLETGWAGLEEVA